MQETCVFHRIHQTCQYQIDERQHARRKICLAPQLTTQHKNPRSRTSVQLQDGQLVQTVPTKSRDHARCARVETIRCRTIYAIFETTRGNGVLTCDNETRRVQHRLAGRTGAHSGWHCRSHLIPRLFTQRIVPNLMRFRAVLHDFLHTFGHRLIARSLQETTLDRRDVTRETFRLFGHGKILPQI